MSGDEDETRALVRAGDEPAADDPRFKLLLEGLYAMKLPIELRPRRDVVLVEEGGIAYSRRDIFLERFRPALEESCWYTGVADALQHIAEAPELKAGMMPAMVIVGRCLRVAWLRLGRNDQPDGPVS
jgi:hypothetical protein